jgi:hypothetical protein
MLKMMSMPLVLLLPLAAAGVNAIPGGAEQAQSRA